jgi:bifunctional non-homologous end joining protein LigD
VDYPLVNDVDALLWMVDFGCVDMHLWLSRCASPSEPDFVLFDLDVDPVRGAQRVRAALDALGLESLVKTSGGGGLHVVVPIGPGHEYAQTRAFSQVVADAVDVPVDTKLNGQGMTVASVYSLRPLPGAPVSTPLAWDEVNDKLNPSIYTMPVVLERVRQHGDLYAGVLTTRQSLSKALRKLA